MDMNAAATIRNARTRAGLSLRELGSRAGTSHSAIAAYEAGRKVPSVATMEHIVEACGYDLTFSLTRRPSDEEMRDRERELLDALDLAAQFPAHHDWEWKVPVFGR
jgi:transcriptional regulator with XRE-family HTH domain